MAEGIRLMVTVDDHGTATLEKLTGSTLPKLGHGASSTAKGWKGAFKEMENAATGLHTKLSGWATSIPAMLGLAGLGAGLTMFAKGAIGVNAQVESLTTSFEVFTGSADKAAKVMERIIEFAAKTPYEMVEVANAARLLSTAGLGIEGGDERWLVRIGNLASAAQRPLDELARAVGMINQGVTGEGIRTLSMAGIGRKQLKEKGLEFDKSGEFRGSTEKIMNAIAEIVDKKYGSMMEKQSRTWNGLMSTLKDNWNLARAALMKPTFEVLREKLVQLTDATGGLMKDPQVLAWGDKIAAAVSRFVESTISAVKWTAAHWEGLVAWGTTIGAMIGTLFLLGGALKVISFATAAWTQILGMNPIARIVMLVIVLIPLINRGAQALGGWNVIWQNIWASIKTAGGFLKWFGESAVGTFSILVSAYINYIKTIGSAFASLGTLMFKAVTFQYGDVEKEWEKLKGIIADGITSAADSAKGIGNVWSEGWDNFSSDTQARFGELGKSAGKAFSSGMSKAWVFGTGGQPDPPMTPTLAATLAAIEQQREASGKLRAESDRAFDLFQSRRRDEGAGGVVEEARGMLKPSQGFMARETERSLDTNVGFRQKQALDYEGQAGLAAEKFAKHYEKIWGGMWGAVAEITEYGLSDIFSAVLDGSANIEDAFNATWRNMKKSALKAVTDMAAGWLIGHAKMLVGLKTFELGATAAKASGTAARTGLLAVEGTAVTTEAAAEVGGASAKVMGAHAGIPFVGIGIAAGLIAVMLGVLNMIMGKNIFGRREGGPIPGGGSGMEDNVLIAASGGEYMQPASAVKQYGQRFMDSVRTGSFDPQGSSVNLNLTVYGGGEITQREVETDLAPLLARLKRQRRWKVSMA
jgi:hypothetical protein